MSTHKASRSLLLNVLITIFFCSLSYAAQDYYVDSVGGSDSNSGTSTSSPWRSLSPVNSRAFQPGDSIHFKAGSSWSGGLSIRNSGTSTSPITYKAYGTGNRPVFANPGVNYGNAIEITADYVIVEGFLVRDAMEAGVNIRAGADHNTVRDVEATATGIGFLIRGNANLITQCYAHDLKMIVNTPGGNEDYGAVGFWLADGADGNEISYSTCINCRAPSFDYGYDGGFVEGYGGASNTYIHHNYVENTEGGVELGAGTFRDITLAYNVFYNNEGITWVNSDAAISNYKFENNTIIQRTGRGRARAIFATASPTGGNLIIRNNIVYSNIRVSNQTDFVHSNNLYYLLGGASLGLSQVSGEQIADPMFVNLNGRDFRLQPGSPAINKGMNLGYSVDYNGNALVGAPDLGAFEYGSSGVAPAAPTGLRVLPAR